MNIVDSSGWLEYFAEGTNANFFAPAIEETTSLIMPTLNLFEVFKKILRECGEEEALEAVAVMQQGKVVDLDVALSLQAARLSHVLKLPLADSIILATARNYQATLWTQDEDFEGLEGVNYIKK